MKKIAIFVDGPNLGRVMKTCGFRVDYQKVREYFANQGMLLGSYYFTALPPANGAHSPIRSLTENLSRQGWTAITKDTKLVHSEDMTMKPKGNMDVEMVVWAWKLSKTITDLILFSGDGDFKAMVDQLKECGVRTTAVSLLLSGRGNVMADELRRTVHEFIDIPLLRQYIERRM